MKREPSKSLQQHEFLRERRSFNKDVVEGELGKTR